MADSRFFAVSGPFTLSQLAQIADAEIAGAGDPAKQFCDVRPLDTAGPAHVSFLDNQRYAERFTRSAAGAVLVAPELIPRAPDHMALLVSSDPYRGYARVAAAFYPTPPAQSRIHPTAVIEPSAGVGVDVEVGPGAVIMAGATIGRGSRIGAATVVGESVEIGEDCRIGTSASLAFCKIGVRAIIHAGVRIGQDGFGFAPGADAHLKVPQLGLVLIGDDVELGANTSIDRGTGPDTVIGSGTKIDNLVQIAHNVQIGEGCLIAAQVGISGSTVLGDHVMIGGQAGIAGHLNVGSGVRIAGQSGVTRDIEPGITVAGMPATKAREHWRRMARLNRLAKDDKGS